MNLSTQAVLLNAVPLLLLAALYLAVGVAIAPALWREHGRFREIGLATALLFPCIGAAALLVGIEVLVSREPLAGNAALGLVAILVTALPGLVVLGKWDDRHLLVSGSWRAREAEERSSLRDRELGALGRVTRRALDDPDPDGVAAALLDELSHLFGLDVANFLLVDEDGRRAVVVAAREGGEDNDALAGQQLELDREPSGVSTALREGAAFAVYDAESSGIVNPRLNAAARARSCAFVPVRVGERTLGVVFAGVRTPRIFDDAELARMQAFVAEGAFALDRAGVARDPAQPAECYEALAQAAAALSEGIPPDAVLERLLAALRGALAADAAECWLPAAPGGEPELRAAAGEARDTGTPHEEPIVVAGERVGTLRVHGPGVAVADLALVRAFASLAAAALRPSGADDARRASARRGLERLSAVLSDPLSAEETLDAVAQAAAEALGGDSAAVLRPAGRGLAPAGTWELAPPLAERLSSAPDELRHCLDAGKVLAARRLEGDSRFGEALAAAAAAAERTALLAVPVLEAGGAAAALVLVFFREERSFDDADLELAAQMAAAARGAVGRSDLYERERRSRSLAQHLARAGRELAGELDPEDVLDEAVRHAAAMLAGDGASVRLLDGDEVVLLAATGPGAETTLGVRAPSTGWLVGDIVQTRATRAIADARDDARLLDADPLLRTGHAAYLGAPMIGPEDSVLGILAVYGARPRDWRQEETEALEALAATAAAAYTNAELYQGVSHEQQRSEAILANVADGIVAVDRDGKVVLWNPAAERVTGVPAEDALGHTPTQVLGRTLDADPGRAEGSRLVPIRRGGDEVWLSLSEAVMTDPAGAVAGRIYTFRDISAERSVERMKTDFVSTVSHELRTPLTSIYGFAETLLRQDVLFGEDERATFLRYIASESERLTSIVDRLLSVAQVDTGDVAVQLAETDVAALVTDVVRTVEKAEADNGHRFVVELDDEPLAAEADREKLGQVLSHLLDNAVRYSPAGGTVTVAARRRKGAVEVSVEDEGIGIPHSEQERIFRKFYRGESTASGAVGTGATGLGLFLAEGLVNAMGGRIWVDSREGRGSTFVLELRAAETET